MARWRWPALLRGIIAGLLGVGGGIVMVPVMTTIFAASGMDEAVILHVAVATSLAVIVPTGTSSALAHHRKAAVSGELLKLWAPFMVVASFLAGISAGVLFVVGDAVDLRHYGDFDCSEFSCTYSEKVDGTIVRFCQDTSY